MADTKEKFFELSKEEIWKLKVDPNVDVEKQFKSIQLWITKTTNHLIEKWIEKNEINDKRIKELLSWMFWINISLQYTELWEDVVEEAWIERIWNYSIADAVWHLQNVRNSIVKQCYYNCPVSFYNLWYWKDWHENELFFVIQCDDKEQQKMILENKARRDWFRKLSFRALSLKKWIKWVTNYIEYVYIICAHYFVLQTLLKLTNQTENWVLLYNKTKAILEEMSLKDFYFWLPWKIWFQFAYVLYIQPTKFFDKTFKITDFFQPILQWWYIYETNQNYIFREKYTWDRKEYAKVYQQENLRAKDKTWEILETNVFWKDSLKDLEQVYKWKDAINLFKEKDIKLFVSTFKWIEIDENTNIAELNKFFDTFYIIIKEIQAYLKNFHVNIYTDILPKVFFKIRKLWQYKANWIFFWWNNTLALDIRWRDSIIHELWHMVHFNLWDLLWNKKIDFIWFLTNKLITRFIKYEENSENDLWYKQLQLLSFIYKERKALSNEKNYRLWYNLLMDRVLRTYWKMIRPDTMKIDLDSTWKRIYWPTFHNKLKKEYEDVSASFKYDWYVISSTEIFARLFDVLIRTKLQRKELNIANKDWRLYEFDAFLIWWVYWAFRSRPNYHQKINQFFKAFYYYTLDTFNYLKNNQ